MSVLDWFGSNFILGVPSQCCLAILNFIKIGETTVKYQQLRMFTRGNRRVNCICVKHYAIGSGCIEPHIHNLAINRTVRPASRSELCTRIRTDRRLSGPHSRSGRHDDERSLSLPESNRGRPDCSVVTALPEILAPRRPVLMGIINYVFQSTSPVGQHAIPLFV